MIKSFNSHIISNNRFIFHVNTDQGPLVIKSHTRINYKETARNLYKKGYTNVQICFIGREF